MKVESPIAWWAALHHAWAEMMCWQDAHQWEKITRQEQHASVGCKQHASVGSRLARETKADAQSARQACMQGRHACRECLELQTECSVLRECSVGCEAAARPEEVELLSTRHCCMHMWAPGQMAATLGQLGVSTASIYILANGDGIGKGSEQES